MWWIGRNPYRQYAFARKPVYLELERTMNKCLLALCGLSLAVLGCMAQKEKTPVVEVKPVEEKKPEEPKGKIKGKPTVLPPARPLPPVVKEVKPQEPEKPVVKERPTVLVAGDVYGEYKENPVAAEKKYAGKLVEVSGDIDRIEVVDGNALVVLHGWELKGGIVTRSGYISGGTNVKAYPKYCTVPKSDPLIAELKAGRNKPTIQGVVQKWDGKINRLYLDQCVIKDKGEIK